MTGIYPEIKFRVMGNAIALPRLLRLFFVNTYLFHGNVPGECEKPLQKTSRNQIYCHVCRVAYHVEM